MEYYFEVELTQQQIDRISLILRKEISIVYDNRHKHQLIVDINSKQTPEFDNESKEQKRKELIENHQKIVDMFTKDIEILESVQTELLEHN